MSVPSNTDERTRELLVAYLDGELSPEESRDVERRIGEDAALRGELQSLEKAWNALDELPQEDVGEEFSKTTIEMVAVEAEREVAQLTSAMPVVRRRRRGALIALAAAALAAGFFGAYAVVNGPNRQLAHDLPVLWGIEPLSQNVDAEFLTLIAQRQPELIERYGGADAVSAAEAWTAIEEESLRQRQSRVGQLTGTEKDQLQTAQRQFAALSQTKRDALWRRYDTLSAAQEDPARLRLAAMAYARWAAGQTPNTQLELRQISDPGQRVARVAELRRQELRTGRPELTPDEAESLRAAVEQAADLPEVDALLAALRESRDTRLDAWERRAGPESPVGKIREWSDKFDRAIESRAELKVSLVPQVAYDSDRGRRGKPWPWIPESIREDAKQVWSDVERALISSLSPATQAELGAMRPDRRGARMRQWTLGLVSTEITPAKREEFFASDALTNTERTDLLALPKDEMDARLKHLYVERELGGIAPEVIEDMSRRLGVRPDRERARPDGPPSMRRPGDEDRPRGPGPEGPDRKGPNRDGR